MADYNIVNIVASASLGVNVDLFGLALNLDNVEYEPEQFPGAIIKLDEPKVAILLFKTGNIICAGARRERDIERAVEKVKELLKSQGITGLPDKVEYNIVNIVASASLGITVDLFAIALNLDNVEYEPEQFPGAIIKLDEPKVAILLFKTGNIICAGARRERDIERAVEKVKELVAPFAQ